MNCMEESNIGVHPHLSECTASDDTQRVYAIGPGAAWDELTEDEQKLCHQSWEYIRSKVIRKLSERIIKDKNAFERLRDIQGMPEEAIEILKEFAPRPEDGNQYWADDENTTSGLT